MLLLLGAVLYLVQSEFGLAQVRTVDRCCEDFDGGGDRDDGMLVVSRRGSEVQRLAIYEDLDGSRSYTAGTRSASIGADGPPCSNRLPPA
jgi:hypothetical protein